MQVLTPQYVTLPPAEQELYVVRGDVLSFDLGFVGAPDIKAILPQRRLRLVFRRRQNDSAPDLVVVQATLEADPPDTFNGRPVDIMGRFSVSPEQTQTLPASGCFYFIEWTNAIGGQNRRIVQGHVQIGD